MLLLFILMIFAGFGLLITSLIKFGGEDKKNGLIFLVVSLIAGGIGMWGTAPWWHWLWFNLTYLALPFWIITIVIFGAAFILYKLVSSFKKPVEKENRFKEKYYEDSGVSKGWFFVPATIIFCVFAITMAIMCGSISSEKIYKTLKPEYVSQLHETTEIRYLPMEVARTYGENKIQESEIRLGDADPIIYDGGKLDWVMARVPNGFWRSISNKADGFSLVMSDGSVQRISQPMTYGEGMFGENDINWQLFLKKYFVNVPEIYYVFSENNKEIVGVAPYLGYKMDFPVMIPYWEGVFIFHPDGKIDDLTPQQAQALPYMKGQRLFPEELARIQVESWAYKYGIGNAWFNHNDQIQIPQVQHSSNQMPYLIPTDSGPKWFVAAEPTGSSYGVFKIFFIDAFDGKMEVYELSKESALIGPNRIWEYIKSEFPDYKWGEITLLEPRPVVNKNILYWMVSITSTSIDSNRSQHYGSISATLLVNAKTNEVLAFKAEQGLRNFLKKGETESSKPIIPAVSPSASSQGVSDLAKQANYYFAEYRRLTGEGKLVEAAQALENLQKILQTLLEKNK